MSNFDGTPRRNAPVHWGSGGPSAREGKKLAAHGVSLLTAVEEWISFKAKSAHIVSKPVPEIVAELLTAKELEGVSKRHLEYRQSRLNRFAQEFDCRIDRVTAKDIDLWLAHLKIGSRTKNSYRGALQQIFRFAQSRRYLVGARPLIRFQQTDFDASEDVLLASGGSYGRHFHPPSMKSLGANVQPQPLTRSSA